MFRRAVAFKGWSLLLLCLGWGAPCWGQAVPNKLITTTITPPGPVAVGQTITVTMRVTAYDGPPADGFGFLVIYDPLQFAFVPDSFDLGTNAGPAQQWLTKPNQETPAEGYEPRSFCAGDVAGEVLLSMADAGRGFPRRGVVASAGFLASFQLVASLPGTHRIWPTNYLGSALQDTALQTIAGVQFSGATVLVRDTDLIPNVAIVNPTGGSTFHSPAKIGLTAEASVTNGSITRVEFFADDLPKLGEATSAPYSLFWVNPPPGEHRLLAIATDNFGGVAASEEVLITVNAVPTIALTSPANGALFTSPGTIALTANASDGDGSLVRVEFHNGTTLLGTATNTPYAWNWTNVAEGTYTLTALAVDDRGGTTVSAPVTVTVRAATGAA